MTCGTEVGTDFILKGKVAGASVEISADRSTCIGTTISNPGLYAIGSGEIQFTGLTVKQPAGCKTSSSITTKSLETQVMMEGATVYSRFRPSSGTVLANLSLTECAAEGTYPLKGTMFGRFPNSTGVLAAEQNWSFSSTINATAGGALTLGFEPATLTGEERFSTFGSTWGATE